MEKPVNINTRMTFAGVNFKTTKNANVRRPALLKILRSGKVEVSCNYSLTDDYAFDNAVNFRRGSVSDEMVVELANDIERSPSGWSCSAWQCESGTLRLTCHSFKSYTLRSLV